MNIRLIAMLAVACSLAWAPARADVSPGRPAPDFALRDTSGNTVSLASQRGKVVVLEWVNHGCPFVRKHYGSNNMQSLQKRYGGQGVVWFAIQSTHPGHPDYQDPPALEAAMRAAGAAPAATLLDPDGEVGRKYAARTTPQMFVIDARGVVAYAGAIDDRRSTNPDDVKVATNHVAAALDAIKAGKPVAPASTVPYGCSVKYR